MKIKKISLGLRHRRTFRIADIVGSIVDHVVHNEDSPFGQDFFRTTNVVVDDIGEDKGRVIADETGATSLVVDRDSVILNLETSDVDETLKAIKSEYIPYITKSIHKKFEIENFNRLGIVYEYDIAGEPNHLVSRLTKDVFSNAQTGSFKFGSKEIDLKSLVMKDLLDYKNHLITIEFNEKVWRAKFDYQFYFQPEIKSPPDVDFNGFVDESKTRLESKFLAWINHEE